jgi:photosystem II protein
MVIEIQFIEGIKELTLPIVRLTKSRNGETGTATFIFIKPEIFKEYISQISTINGMYLIWDNKKIISQDIYILFKNGEPFLIKTIFIFKNSNEWFQFLNFMNSYSKETGLLFG